MRRRGGLLAAAFFCIIAISGAAALDTASIENAVEQVLSASTIQSEMPHDEPPPSVSVSPIVEFIANMFGWLAPLFNSVLKLLIWAAILVAAALLIMLVVTELSRYLATVRGRTTASADSDDVDEDGLALDGIGTLADADRLAEAGDFAGAVRILLFRSLDALREKVDLIEFPFLTSRELLELAPLGDRAKNELGEVISIEELSHFGGRVLNGETYSDCRGSFVRFVEECGGTTA